MIWCFGVPPSPAVRHFDLQTACYLPLLDLVVVENWKLQQQSVKEMAADLRASWRDIALFFQQFDFGLYHTSAVASVGSCVYHTLLHVGSRC